VKHHVGDTRCRSCLRDQMRINLYKAQLAAAHRLLTAAMDLLSSYDWRPFGFHDGQYRVEFSPQLGEDGLPYFERIRPHGDSAPPSHHHPTPVSED